MPRHAKKRPGSRDYCNYSKDQMEQALVYVANGKSINQSAKDNGVKYGTLRNRVCGLHLNPVGRPTALSANEESMLASMINTLSIWRQPVSREDLRYIIKHYLDSKKTIITEFNDNLPGVEWVMAFKKRHNLNERMAANIKVSRAEIESATVNQFFDNYESNLEGVSKERVCNFDETNFTNDPGTNRVICKRGLKRLERKMDFSMSSTSVMLAGFADDTVLPPMVA